MNNIRLIVGVVVCLAFLLAASRTALAADYPREDIYDLSSGPDEAAVNVSLASNRWPDCTTLESTIADMFRLEGVTDKPDQDKALAMWKWFRVMVSGTGGYHAYEGPPDAQVLVHDPHKIFAVYGHHQCDGQSWAMVPLWRAAGYMAFDECHNGHTIAALCYRDADGVMRYHNFDPQNKFFFWDGEHNRVGTWSMPVMTGHLFRHLVTPQNVHTLRAGLRIGETVQRNWTNTGHVVPSGKPEEVTGGYARYYEYKPGRKDGIYACVGEEVQTLAAETDPAAFRGQLFEGSANVACSAKAAGKATLHPAEAGKPATFVYRLAPPYVIADATIEATLVKAAAGDVCRLSISRDGGPWKTVFEKKDAGTEPVKIDLGPEARKAGRPDAFTAYSLLVKAEFQAAGDAAGVGTNDLKVTAYRMLNKRALPNLMPGENVFRVNCDKLAAGQAIRLTLDYEKAGSPKSVSYTIAKFPFYFAVDEPGWELRKLARYDTDFNNETVRMVGYSMKLAPAAGAKLSESLPADAAEAKFKAAFPHPADMTSGNNRKVLQGEQVESDPIQTNGFLPQSRVVAHDKARMEELIGQTRTAKDFARSTVLQKLGDYPEALDFLLGELPGAGIDDSLYVIKALAQIGDAKAIDPLLAKWKRGMKAGADGAVVGVPVPGGSPGSRYIPDALAAIAIRTDKVDPRIVPMLAGPLKNCRFDFRFHIAHALGELAAVPAASPADRKLAEAALNDLAANDPFPACRDEAKDALKRLAAAKPRAN